MMRKKITLAALFAVAILFVTSEVNAQLKGEAMAGYGFKDGYNIGIGVRAGKDGLIESQKQIYIGGVFAYHLGKTEETPDFGGVTSKVTVNLWYAGGDVGYNIPLEGQSFKLRASAYVGVANISSKFETTGGGGGGFGGGGFGGGSSSGSSTEFMLAPGATFYFPIGSDLTFGADARFFIVSNSNALVVNATIGKSF
jgi:uncharacterized membrane protein YgcG